MVESKLTDGAFYWVRPAPDVDWEPAQFLDGAFHFIGDRNEVLAAEVGPQISPPD